jgi:hypothetical protein
MLASRLPIVAALLFAALLATPSALTAQSDLTISPSQCVWRQGDNPAWAAPDLDESAWAPFSGWKFDPSEPRFWIRCSLDPTTFRGVEHPGLQVNMLAAYEAFLNGASIARNGNLSSGGFSTDSIRTYPVPPTLLNHGPGVLALRVAQRAASEDPPSIRLGEVHLLANDRSGFLVSQIPLALLNNVPFIVIGIIGVVLLGFSLYDRTRIELILLAVSCVAVGLVFLGVLCNVTMVNAPARLTAGVWDVAGVVSIITQCLFNFALARRRIPIVFWLLMSVWIFVAAWNLVELFAPLQLALRLDGIRISVLQPLDFAAATVLASAPFVAFFPWRRVAPQLRTIAGACMLWGISQALVFGTIVTASDLPGIPNLFAKWQNVLFPVSAIGQFFVIAAIIALLLRDQRQVALDRASLAGEIQAAQEIQRALVPASIDALAGLDIGIAFFPAREVGGDFYSCRILPGNRQRVLLGDVSGKGAAAAMTAAVLLGAAQRHESDSPVAILCHLNIVMTQMRLGGFATCICADLSADGTVKIANAGHLSPYRNGAEIQCEPGLPLGMTPDAEYSELAMGLAPGDRITFLSDGVVEARNAAGELFGFERTAAISTQSADSIAHAAQTFGQEDDITVLTLSFVPAEVAHA